MLQCTAYQAVLVWLLVERGFGSRHDSANVVFNLALVRNFSAVSLMLHLYYSQGQEDWSLNPTTSL
jgi:hypothetical protein